MVYENNFSVLRLYYPSLAEKVDDIAANGVTIVQARSGSYTCKISTDGGRWIYLHSRYDPEREVELLLQNLDLSRDSILALLGLGLGYLFFAILSKLDRDYPILVFEKRVDVFKRSLELFDWREPLKRKNLRFFIGKEIHEIEEEINEKIKVDYWSDLLRKDIKLLKHPPSINLYPDYYHRIEHAINESRESFLIRRMEVIKNTRLVDRLLWGLKDVLLTREGVDSVKDSIEYTKGLVSIIMPVHNRLECLKEVLASLYKYTTYSPWELIIWDNNSNEETKTYLRGLTTNPLNPKIRTEIIFHPENIGKNCLNRCIKEYAQGEYIIIMDK